MFYANEAVSDVLFTISSYSFEESNLFGRESQNGCVCVDRIVVLTGAQHESEKGKTLRFMRVDGGTVGAEGAADTIETTARLHLHIHGACGGEGSLPIERMSKKETRTGSSSRSMVLRLTLFYLLNFFPDLLFFDGLCILVSFSFRCRARGRHMRGLLYSSSSSDYLFKSGARPQSFFGSIHLLSLIYLYTHLSI